MEPCLDIGTGVDAGPLPTVRWVHVFVTYGSGTAVPYVDGREAGRNTDITDEPRDFGNHIRSGYSAAPGTPTRSRGPGPGLTAVSVCHER
ncbi:LamG-like jellyroll fold domain-containing protein [Streptomyces achromogenes]|uniref:LamG-like jellyroll fold domain-containing protein n=1 Tax=Streptomyces achromogenes TaxID=67255 RepID=UPI0037D9579E